MNMRWLLHNPSPEFPIVGHTIVASWLPWRYYLVFTFGLWCDPTDSGAKLIVAISGKSPEPEFHTKVSKCDRDGLTTPGQRPFYERTYATVDEARVGHQETAEALFHGRLRLHQWTRRAVPGKSRLDV